MTGPSICRWWYRLWRAVGRVELEITRHMQLAAPHVSETNQSLGIACTEDASPDRGNTTMIFSWPYIRLITSRFTKTDC